MIAVIETGGKQYVVREGQTLAVEKLPAEPKAPVTFDRVLLVADGTTVRVGSPYLAGAKVSATCEAQARGPKVRVQKYHAKTRYRRNLGHRQYYTRVKIEKISS
jgi:large subunit ribosomal protein L21